jgi:hypothetical protein
MRLLGARMNRLRWLYSLACVVLVAVLLITGLAPVRAVSVFCYATPVPDTASTPAGYTIRISTNLYDRIDQLRVKFPFDTGFTMGSFAPSAIVVNGVASKGGQTQKLAATNQIQMDILLSSRLVVGTPITIVVAREAGIINPLSPRSCYRLMVSFFRDGREINWVESDLYIITPSAVGSVSASIDPAVAGAAAEVVATFITGSNGRLKAGQDSVSISFPPGFIFPQSFGLIDVTLNGVSCAGRVFRDNTSPNTVLVYVPVDIPAGSLVSISIPSKAGIRSPSVAGLVILKVNTTAETTPIDAPAIQIRGREVTGLAVQLTAPVAGLPTGVRVQFGLSAVGRLAQSQRVYVRLPVGYVMPVPTRTVSATVNGTDATVSLAEGVVEIAAPAYLADRALVEVVFPADFGIINPTVPTGYAWTVWTDGDAIPMVAMAVVRAPSASGATLSSSTRAIGRDASWTIELTPSAPSTFPIAGDSITIVFDEVVLVPVQLGLDAITVNGVPCAATAQGTAVTVTVPVGVVPAAVVTVQISEQAGIRTPAMPTTVRARVATTRDSTSIVSNVLEFKALPVVTMVVTPDVPNGLAGRYIGNRPGVQLVCDNATLYYRIDAESFQQYVAGTSILIPAGTHTLSAYAVTGDGTQGEAAERTFAVDLSRPVVTIDGFPGDILVRSPQVTLTGTVSEPVELVQVNGVPAAVALDNTFAVTVTVGDGQALVCYARDLAGNTTSFVRTVRVDSTPPVITRVGAMVALGVVYAEELEVRVTVSEAAILTVNGQPMMSASPEYAATIPLQKGVNEVTVRALDGAGNEGILAWTVTRTDTVTIRLMAGAPTATVGDEERILDAPPVIVNGVTFVPLRFIGEALGAEVAWNEALKVVFLSKGPSRVQLSIGSRLAIIDGRITQLLEVPFIQNGRTMVPLRFISEAFGAEVTWDQATKAVTVALANAA